MAVRERASELLGPSPSVESYYVSRNGQTVGPVPATQVALWVKQGMTDAHVRTTDGAAWLHLRQSPFAAELPALAAGPARAASNAPRPRQPSGVEAFFWSCFHFLRWCTAACVAFVLSVGIVTTMCATAPMSVLDSRDFWVKWAEVSPLMASAHEGIDSVLDGAKRRLTKSDSVVAHFGDTHSMAAAVERARPAVHGAIAGHVIDAAIGFVTGRDDELQLDTGLPDLRRRISREIADAYAAEHCGSSASNSAGCIAGKVALEVGASDAVWETVSASLGEYNPFSGAFVANLIPGLTVVRTSFAAVRGVIAIAPFMLTGIGLVLLLTSLRMKTACFMLGWAFVLAGAVTGLIGWCARELAAFFGMSPEVWELVADESGMVQAGVGADIVLVAIGLGLLVVRAFGPRWRKAFWQRRASSTDPKVVALAQERLSRPAGLLEPFHVVTAPKP